MKPSQVIQGMYAVNILKNASAKIQYVTPNHSGITLQKQTLENMKAQADKYLYSILNAGENASGQAINLRLQFTTTSLVGLVKNIRKCNNINFRMYRNYYGYKYRFYLVYSVY